jgi:hypothetical protein
MSDNIALSKTRTQRKLVQRRYAKGHIHFVRNRKKKTNPIIIGSMLEAAESSGMLPVTPISTLYIQGVQFIVRLVPTADTTLFSRRIAAVSSAVV